jgi:hypothetical protein
MAILTYAEAKQFLQISGTDNDTLISALIPVVQSEIIEITNNHFLNLEVYTVSAGISFTAKAGATAAFIEDTAAAFVADFFAAGHILVDGSKHNDGIWLAGTVAAGKLTLSTLEDQIVTEAAGETIGIYTVKFPTALKLTAAKMIGVNLVKNGVKGITSFSLGDYSESYSGEGGYPAGVLNELKKYRRVKSS